MGKIIRRTLTALLIVTSLLTAAIVGAAIQTFDGKGEWHTNDDDNQQMAMNRAEQRAKTDAQKKAGVYLKTYSRSVNATLTDDEISAVTNNITNIVGEVHYDRKAATADGEPVVIWTATLTANIDTNGIFDFIKRDDKEKVTIIQQNNDLKDAIAKNDTLAENLQEQYKRATTQAEKDRLRKQMNDADRDFLANQKLEEGIKLAYAKNYHGAIKLFNEALEIKPNFDRAYNCRGAAYKDLKQNENAIQDLNKAIQLNPNYFLAYVNRGSAYRSLKQNERAIQDLNKAIQLNPNLSEAYSNRGNIYSDFGQYERAIQDYNKAIQLKTNNALAWSGRGTVYNNLGQYERAIPDFNKAIELNPNLAEAYANRGVAYVNLGQYERAIQDFNKAIELNPKNYYSYANRGSVYFILKKYQQALKDFDKAIELNPNNNYAKNKREECLRAMGK